MEVQHEFKLLCRYHQVAAAAADVSTFDAHYIRAEQGATNYLRHAEREHESKEKPQREVALKISICAKSCTIVNSIHTYSPPQDCMDIYRNETYFGCANCVGDYKKKRIISVHVLS